MAHEGEGVARLTFGAGAPRQYARHCAFERSGIIMWMIDRGRCGPFSAALWCAAFNGFASPRMTSVSSRRPYRIGRSRTGLGLFATKTISKGDFIAKYWGTRLRGKEAEERDNRYMFEVNARWTVDGSTRRNIARYINHSCRPNAEPDIVKGEILIHAIKTIRPGDEITYNYGKDYFDAFIRPIGCRCVKCEEKRRAARIAARMNGGNGKSRRAAANGKSPAPKARNGKSADGAHTSARKRTRAFSCKVETGSPQRTRQNQGRA